MAEPIDLSSFDKSASKKEAGISLDSFDVNQKSEGVDLSAFETGAQGGIPVEQVPVPENVPIEDKAAEFISGAIPQPIKDGGRALGEYVANSPVGTALKSLNKPMNYVSGKVVDVLEATVAPGLNAKLNPSDAIFPDIAYHDIINEVVPPNDKAEELAKKFGLSGWSSDSVRLGYAATKWGVGLAADLFLDPINAVSFGTLTAASKAARASGKVANVERNILEIGAFGKSIELPAKNVPGATRAEKAVANFSTRVQDALGLDYRTGDPLLDVDIMVHNGMGRGQIQDVKETLVDPIRKMKFSPEENLLLADLIESTPNKTTIGDLKSVGSKLAAEQKIGVSESRLDQISEVALKIKSENERDLAERLYNSVIPDNVKLDTLVIDNYLSHQISPMAKAYIKKNPKMALAIEEVMQKKAAEQTASNTFLSTFDRGKFGREIRTTLREANKIMEEKTGITDWFITDPTVATAIKRLETKRLIRDKNLIESVKERGLTPKEARESGKVGWVPMPVPNESTVAKELAGLVFEPKLADRFSYYISPKPKGHIASFFDSYNRVFRTVALAKPDYYLQNYGENMVKNWALGVKISDYTDAMKVATGKGEISIKSLDGKRSTISAEKLRSLIREYGIDSGGQFLEGVEPLLFTGKKLYSENRLVRGYEKSADRIESVFKGIREFGEKGENYTRRALFINRIKQGYKPEVAALDVEKFLFDFTRNGRGTNWIRRYFDPFIQASVKTAQVAPELLGKSPGKYNFVHNNLLSSIEAAFQDPGTAAEVKLILPEYRRFQDPVVGPMLPGNGYIAEMFANNNPNAPKALGGRSYLLFKMPIGLDIMNRFAFWDSNAVKQYGTGSSPLFKSMIIAMTGKDPFTGKDLDMAREVDVARRASAAIENAVMSFMPMPNTWTWLKGKYGITKPEYVTPAAVSMFHASFGKFSQITNLDREYAFRLMALTARERELSKELINRARAESQGKTGDLQAAGTFLEGIVREKNRPYSSARVLNERMQNSLDAKIVKMSGEGLQGYISAAEIAQEIKDTQKRIKELNNSYATNMAVRLNFLKSARKEEAMQLLPEVDPSAFDENEEGRSPQSINGSKRIISEEVDTTTLNLDEIRDVEQAENAADALFDDLQNMDLDEDNPEHMKIKRSFEQQLDRLDAYVERNRKQGSKKKSSSTVKELRARKPTKQEAEWLRKNPPKW